MGGLSSTGRVVLIFISIVWLTSTGIERLGGLIKANESFSSSTRTKSRTSSPTLHLTPLSTNSSASDTLTIVVQLSGELGNHLQKIGAGLCVQYVIERELGIPTEVKLRAQEHAKWKHAMDWTKEAFNGTRALNFREMNTPDFDKAQNEQRTWISFLIEGGKLDVANITNPHMLTDGVELNEDGLGALLKLVNQTWRLRGRQTEGAAISMPHVHINGFMSEYCLDLTYYDLREFLVLDEAANCRALPYPNETVVHFRNFIAEMPRRGMGLGFEEMDETRMTTEVLADLKPGDNVAIVSRMDNNIDKYIKMMELRGLKVRYIRGQTGNQDFCVSMREAKGHINGARFILNLALQSHSS